MNELPFEEIAELQLQSIRRRYSVLDEDDARRLLETRASKWSAEEVHATHGPEGLRGLLLVSGPKQGRWGPAEAQLRIVLDRSEASFEWAREVLREMEPRLPDAIAARLDADYRPLRETLADVGLRVTKLTLAGELDSALSELRAQTTIEAESPDVRFETVASPEDVMAATQLRKSFFVAHPEFGWGTGRPLSEAEQRAIDDRVQNELERRRLQGMECDFLVVDSLGMVVGTFGFRPDANHPIGGSIAGPYICLTDQIQGRGVGRAAYLHMFTRAREMGIECVRGATSNPGVIHLAARQGRHLDHWLMRRDGPFLPDEWWDYPP